MRLWECIDISLANAYENFTYWYWNKKPHHVRCRICGKVKSSIPQINETFSPEQCGWEQTKDGQFWICHDCLCHRDFKPYIKQVDIDEIERWKKLEN